MMKQNKIAMVGSVAVKSQVGEGSHFTLQIPVKWETNEFADHDQQA